MSVGFKLDQRQLITIVHCRIYECQRQLYNLFSIESATNRFLMNR